MDNPGMIILVHSSSGTTEKNLYTMTLAEIMTDKLPIDCRIFLAKVRFQFSLLYSGQTFLDKIYAISKKMVCGWLNFLDNLYINSDYLDLAKQFVQDKYDDQTLTEEEYNILYGLLDSTLPT